MRHRTVRFAAATLFMMLVSVFAAGEARADCHEWPSFVWAKDLPSEAADSRSPGGTIQLNHWNSDLTIWHGGDIMPGQHRANFNYIRTSDGSLRYEYATEESGSNGVIEHEWEQLGLGNTAPGTELAIYGFWLDECGAGFQSAIFLGWVQVDA
jgi:hypothetical protein